MSKRFIDIGHLFDSSGHSALSYAHLEKMNADLQKKNDALVNAVKRLKGLLDFHEANYVDILKEVEPQMLEDDDRLS